MTTFITSLDTSGPGLRLAVKDLIDVAGVPTTSGCRVIAEDALPAERDARCLEGARQVGARIVGKTNLHELAFGVTGINPWFGTPRNPLDETRVPGGSSSGSAVAVATGEADVALGTDTGGSVRIPSACCGTAGLKTTWGRVSTAGVMPLSPSLDTVGPMACDVAGLVAGMQLLEPSFEVMPTTFTRVGRLRLECDPLVDGAIEKALGSTGWELVDLDLPEWHEASTACGLLLVAEAWSTRGALADRHPEELGRDVLERLRLGRDLEAEAVRTSLYVRQSWEARLSKVFEDVELIATPTLAILPPTFDQGEDLLMARCTLPVNLAGVPAVAIPVPTTRDLPASLQLIGPRGTEETLLHAAAVAESAISAASS
jgi:amidase